MLHSRCNRFCLWGYL